MKILFILEHYYPYTGGSETLFKYLTEELSKKGNKVTVITSRFNNKIKREEVINGVTIRRIPLANRYLFTFFSIPFLIKDALNSDLIHTTTYNAALPAFCVAKLTRKKIYITFHEVWGKLWFKLPLISKFFAFGNYCFEQLILKLSFDKYIAVSEYTKEELIKNNIPTNKITRIYNGIDYSYFSKFNYTPSKKKFTYCYFGRLGYSKGLKLILEASEYLKSNISNFQLLLIIPKKPKGFFNLILKLIHKKKLTNYVKIIHNLNRDDLFKSISKTNCILIPSYSEGFCFSAAESIGLKIPIISSNKGALKEVVSGKYIVIKEMTSISLKKAMLNAYHLKWEKSDIKYFHLKDSIENYMKLYQKNKGF